MDCQSTGLGTRRGSRWHQHRALARSGIANRYRQGIVLHGPAFGNLPLAFVIVLQIFFNNVKIGQITSAKDDGGNVFHLDSFLFIILSPTLALLAPVNG